MKCIAQTDREEVLTETGGTAPWIALRGLFLSGLVAVDGLHWRHLAVDSASSECYRSQDSQLRILLDLHISFMFLRLIFRLYP